MSFALRPGEQITETPAPQTYTIKRYPLTWTADDATTIDVDVVLTPAPGSAGRVSIMSVAPMTVETWAWIRWAAASEPTLSALQVWANRTMELITGKTAAP